MSSVLVWSCVDSVGVGITLEESVGLFARRFARSLCMKTGLLYAVLIAVGGVICGLKVTDGCWLVLFDLQTSCGHTRPDTSGGGGSIEKRMFILFMYQEGILMVPRPSYAYGWESSKYASTQMLSGPTGRLADRHLLYWNYQVVGTR